MGELIQELRLDLPPRLLFGWGAFGSLRAQSEALGLRRPLLVTDDGVAAVGLAARAQEALPGALLFTGVHANPSEDDVLAGLDAYRAGGCDGIVALGGGSPLDAAKAIRLLTSHPGPLSRYERTRGGDQLIGPDLPPMVAIPTTAGTGSEVGRGALIVLRESGRKALILSPHLLPSCSICDPELTLRLPAALTAATGFDALSHCIEELLAARPHPLVDALAAEGLRLIAGNLSRAVADGSDREAREAMLLGSLYGGIGFQKGLGAVHALSHPLASLRVHHGTANAILLPHVIRFNRTAVPAGYGRLVEVLRADPAVWVEKLLAETGLPTRLSEVGLRRDRIPALAEAALLDFTAASNPRPLNLEDCIALYEQAL